MSTGAPIGGVELSPCTARSTNETASRLQQTEGEAVLFLFLPPRRTLAMTLRLLLVQPPFTPFDMIAGEVLSATALLLWAVLHTLRSMSNNARAIAGKIKKERDRERERERDTHIHTHTQRERERERERGSK